MKHEHDNEIIHSERALVAAENAPIFYSNNVGLSTSGHDVRFFFGDAGPVLANLAPDCEVVCRVSMPLSVLPLVREMINRVCEVMEKQQNQAQTDEFPSIIDDAQSTEH